MKFDDGSSSEEEPVSSNIKYKTEKSVKLFNDNRTESDLQSPRGSIGNLDIIRQSMQSTQSVDLRESDWKVIGDFIR